MNKTSIEWCDYTWNPVTGCLHGCSYCYARKIAERFRGTKAWPQGFKPTFHTERLNDPAKMKKPQTIFVCSMADLFGEWVEPAWIWGVFQAMDAAPQHTYIMLTKNPEKMKRFAPERGDQPRGVRDNWWFGTSITCAIDTIRIKPLREMDGNRFVSFEPLLAAPYGVKLDGIKQVIIGAQTNPKVLPPVDSIGSITFAAYKAGRIPVFFKDSIPEGAMVRRELAWKIHK